MYRCIAVGLVALGLLCFLGCGGTGAPDPESAPAPPNTVHSAPPVEPVTTPVATLPIVQEGVDEGDEIDWNQVAEFEPRGGTASAGMAR